MLNEFSPYFPLVHEARCSVTTDSHSNGTAGNSGSIYYLGDLGAQSSFVLTTPGDIRYSIHREMRFTWGLIFKSLTFTDSYLTVVEITESFYFIS